MIYNEDDYRQIIIDSLYEEGLVDEELYLKCGKPKHIQALPGDLRTHDIKKLQKRKKQIIREMNKGSKRIANKWHQISDMVDEWHENIPNDNNSQLEWEGVYGLADGNLKDSLTTIEVTLGSSYRSIFGDSFEENLMTHRTENLYNKGSFQVMPFQLPDVFDSIIEWSNQPWDWKGFGIKNMGTFRRRVNKLKEESGILDDYKEELKKTNMKITEYQNYMERVNAKVSGSSDVYDLAKRTRGIEEIHDEADYDGDKSGGGMFSVIANSPEDVRRFGRKVGATEIHHEDGNLYTVLMPYTL